MKINRNAEIVVSSTKNNNRILSNLTPGAKIVARIVSRLDENKALIDIAGTKIIAKFLSEFPQSERVNLLLTSKQKYTFVFKLMDHEGASVSNFKILPFFVAHAYGMHKNLIHLRSRSHGSVSLYQLFKLVMGIPSGNLDGALTALLNGLLKKRILKSDVDKVKNMLILAKGNILPFLGAVLGAIGRFGSSVDSSDTVMNSDEMNMRDGTLFLESILASIEWDEELRESYACFVRWLFSKDDAEYVIPIYDEGKYRNLLVIAKDGMIACAFDLSQLGHVEVFGKEIEGIIHLSIVCKNEKSVEILKRNLYDLQTRLKRAVKCESHVAVYWEADARATLEREINEAWEQMSVDVQA
ncbi:MAG: hypothetical protein N2316_00835 [Spirochaetes bacterium]|nr:hypothetical protein [Spirochaetota bacterium]